MDDAEPEDHPHVVALARENVAQHSRHPWSTELRIARLPVLLAAEVQVHLAYTQIKCLIVSDIFGIRESSCQNGLARPGCVNVPYDPNHRTFLDLPRRISNFV